MTDERPPLRVLVSGATELWADGVRQGHRLDSLGSAALERERPFHVARHGSDLTLCGASVDDLREYPIDFLALEPRLRCPACHELTEAGPGT